MEAAPEAKTLLAACERRGRPPAACSHNPMTLGACFTAAGGPESGLLACTGVLASFDTVLCAPRNPGVECECCGRHPSAERLRPEERSRQHSACSEQGARKARWTLLGSPSLAIGTTDTPPGARCSPTRHGRPSLLERSPAALPAPCRHDRRATIRILKLLAGAAPRCCPLRGTTAAQAPLQAQVRWRTVVRDMGSALGTPHRLAGTVAGQEWRRRRPVRCRLRSLCGLPANSTCSAHATVWLHCNAQAYHLILHLRRDAAGRTQPPSSAAGVGPGRRSTWPASIPRHIAATSQP